MRSTDVFELLRAQILDARVAALSWLLVEGGVPLVVAGSADAEERTALASALLSVDPAREWLVIDATREVLDSARLAALLRGGVGLGLTVAAADLQGVLDSFADAGLPEDGIRRLGLTVMLARTESGLRCRSVHYLRPTERDGQGHLQRRPPAVLAAWDAGRDAYDDYSWGITPELADRVDRAQADLEERVAQRARFLEELAAEHPHSAVVTDRVRRYLADEPARVPAPEHAPARPSPFQRGLTDPDSHQH